MYSNVLDTKLTTHLIYLSCKCQISNILVLDFNEKRPVSLSHASTWNWRKQMERYKLFSRQSVSRLQIFCGGGLPDWIDFGFLKRESILLQFLVYMIHCIVFKEKKSKKGEVIKCTTYNLIQTRFLSVF